MCDDFYCLQSHDRPVNDLSTAVQLTNRLLCFWADGGFVYYKRVSSPSFLVLSQSLIVITTSWFAIALDEIRTRWILREKADCCKQSSEARSWDYCFMLVRYPFLSASKAVLYIQSVVRVLYLVRVLYSVRSF